jgi:hypothetical protein
MISVYLSTNPGREVCVTIWPYSIYQWNKKTKSYDYVGTLYGLDKKLAVKAGEEYPTAADTDGYGTVYYLVDDTATGSAGDSTVMSRSTYESWYEEMFGGAAAKDITYLDMTDENISGILK